MRLDMFRKKSLKAADSSGLQVIPTEAIPNPPPQVVCPPSESLPEVVPSERALPSSIMPQPAPNKDISLEVPPSTSPEFDQPGLETPSRDIPPFTNYPSQPQPQSPSQSQQPPPPQGTLPATEVPPYQPPSIRAPQGGPAIPVPSLWELRHDAHTSHPYYINHTTKQTSWSLPEGDLLESQVDLPPGWEVRFTFDGQRYFLDRAANVISFKDPRVFKRPRRKGHVRRDEVTGQPVGELPEGWTRKVDVFGRAYFLNARGKVCSFEDPRSGVVEYDIRGAAAAAAATGGAGGVAEKVVYR